MFETHSCDINRWKTDNQIFRIDLSERIFSRLSCAKWEYARASTFLCAIVQCSIRLFMLTHTNRFGFWLRFWFLRHRRTNNNYKWKLVFHFRASYSVFVRPVVLHCQFFVCSQSNCGIDRYIFLCTLSGRGSIQKFIKAYANQIGPN